jgi:hypothetical protein
MTFKQRLPYYLFGFLIGMIVVLFIWNKKGTEFNYGPNARVLKNIRTKTQVFSIDIANSLASKQIDTSTISEILKNGNVDMWNKVKVDTCTIYTISGKKELKNMVVTVKNCDSIVFIEKIRIE